MTVVPTLTVLADVVGLHTGGEPQILVGTMTGEANAEVTPVEFCAFTAKLNVPAVRPVTR